MEFSRLKIIVAVIWLALLPGLLKFNVDGLVRDKPGAPSIGVVLCNNSSRC